MRANIRLKSEKVSVLPLPLILDFIGPFVVHLQKGIACIHTPICSDHFANLITDLSDISLDGQTAQGGKGFVYHFKDGTAPTPGNCAFDQPEQLVLLSHNMDPLPAKDCHLVFKVPYPDLVVALHPEPIWMHKNDADVWVENEDDTDIVNQPRARGLRFIYNECKAEPMVEPTTQSSEVSRQTSQALDFFCCQTLGLTKSHFNMTLRFAANHATADDRHQDAYGCFQTMRGLIPNTEKWRVDFSDADNSIDLLNITGPHPRDCGAAIMVIHDSTLKVKGLPEAKH